MLALLCVVALKRQLSCTVSAYNSNSPMAYSVSGLGTLGATWNDEHGEIHKGRRSVIDMVKTGHA